MKLLRRLRSICLEGFAIGALLYGSVVAVMHAVHNRLESVGDGVVVFFFLALLYGLWAAAVFGAAGVGAEVVGRLRRRGDEGERPAGFLPGILLFHLVFWELAFLYGLTYDQVPAVAASGRWAMLAFLAVSALGIAGGAAAVSWLLAAAIRRLAARGWLRWTAGGLLAAGLAASALTPLFLGGAPSRGEEASHRPQEGSVEPEIEVRDTGVQVVFVGLDGADWQVISPLMARGELPAFARLVEEGASGPLASLPDANSAVIWASIFSGTTPEVHGVHDFYRVELPGLSTPGLYPVHRTFFQELADLVEPLGALRRTLVSRYSHHAAPWWEVADHAGLSTGVVDGYLFSFPASTPRVPESYFLAYGSDAFAANLAERGAADVGLFLQPPSLFRGLRDVLEAGGDFGWQSRALLQLLAERPQPRLLTFYTHEPDTVQHQEWKWFEPELYFGAGEAEVARRGEAIPRQHREFDDFLARLRQAVGPQTVIVVASDHGHSPTLVHKLYTQHRHGPPGVVLLAGGPVRAGMEVRGAGVYDLFPTLLHLLGLPVPEDQPGRVLEETLDPGFLARFPVRTIPSYDFLAAGQAGDGLGLDPERNRQELEKLKSLGYI